MWLFFLRKVQVNSGDKTTTCVIETTQGIWLSNRFRIIGCKCCNSLSCDTKGVMEAAKLLEDLEGLGPWNRGGGAERPFWVRRMAYRTAWRMHVYVYNISRRAAHLIGGLGKWRVSSKMKENPAREGRQDLTCSKIAHSPSSQFSYKSMLDYSVLYCHFFFKGITWVSRSGPQPSWHQGLVLGRTVFPWHGVGEWFRQ